MIKFLVQAKELNIPCENVTSREDLKKSIKGIIIQCKKIIFGVDTNLKSSK